MKIVRFAKSADQEVTPSIGAQLDEGLFDVSSALQMLGVPGEDIPTMLQKGYFSASVFEQAIDFAQENTLMDRLLVKEPVSILLPYRPAKIVALGLNYTAHAAESGFAPPEEPVIFTKASTCVIGPGEPIEIKKKWGRIDPEVELAVIIGLTAKNVKEEDALDYVAGYSILNDVSARDMQSEDFSNTAPWYRSKSIDTFGPFGPCIVTADEFTAPVEIELECIVNGEVRQKDNTRNLIFGIPKLIAFITDMITLEPGDVISTGTPEGIAEIVEGDVVQCRVEGIGTLENHVAVVSD